MISYKDILDDEYIKNAYSTIDKINTYAFSHGLQHINNVCHNMKTLCQILKINKEMEESLLIDVGQKDGRENHGLKARLITEKLFSNDLKQDKYYDEILHSIEVHDHKSIGDESLFCLLLKCADTLDFTKKRLVTDCKNKELYKIWEDIEDIKINLKNNYFILNIITSGKDNFKEEFAKQEFTKKIVCSFTNLAHKVNLMPIFKINGQEIKEYMSQKILDNYIIIHGSFGSSNGNWFPWLKEKLENMDLTVDVPQMPVGMGVQNFESWSYVLDKLKVDENTIIIAHSIAPIFVCKYLITKKIKVKKLIFVCGFNNYLGISEEYDTVNKPMFIDNLMDVKKYCDNIICYYSDNDPYVKYEVEKAFADTISNEQHIIHNGGHINSESGYTEFEEILENV